MASSFPLKGICFCVSDDIRGIFSNRFLKAALVSAYLFQTWQHRRKSYGKKKKTLLTRKIVTF